MSQRHRFSSAAVGVALLVVAPAATAQPPPTPPAPPAPAAAPAPRNAAPWSADTCSGAYPDAKKARSLVCIDLTNGVEVVSAPPSNILQPNQALTVVVRHWPDEDVDIELSGTPGIAVPSQQPSSAEVAPPGVRAPAFADTAIAALRFAPRQPPSADLVVKTKASTAQDKDYVQRIKVELLVEQRYWGAVRFGLATLFGDFRGYDVKTFAGSQTAQIVENRIPLQFEFVVGFAPYLESFWGGRAYSGSVPYGNIHVAPFIGFGLLGQSVDKLDALTSFHGGLEFEFAHDFSLAATFVVRRMPKLSTGYAPGSPVAAGTTVDQFTGQGAVFAGALVLNASPSFLQFALGGSGKGGK